MFIPEGLLNKEKEHVEGFAPEVAWVTYGGSEKLAESALRQTDFRDSFLRPLRENNPLLERPAEALQSVVLGRPLGKDHPSVPSYA